MKKHRFTRHELYDILWTKSTAQLAKELDIKASHIRKICRHYQISLPSSGYWQKLAFGKEVYKERFWPIEKYDSFLIDLKESFEDERDHYLKQLSQRTKEIQLDFPTQSLVPKRLYTNDIHVRKAKQDLALKKSSSWRGFEAIICSSCGILAIEVCKGNIPRALRFYEGFIKLLRLRGHTISINQNSTEIRVYEQKYKIRLREKSNRVTIKDDRLYPSSVMKPNGKLSLKLDHSYSTTEWTDGYKTIEEQLPKIIAAFELKAEKDIAEQKRRELEWAERDRLKAIEEEIKVKKQWEVKKVALLVEHYKSWTEAQQLKSFINMIEMEINTSDEQNEWVTWAKHTIESLDPLSNGMATFVDCYKYKA